MARRFSALAPRPTTLAEAWRCTHPARVLLAEADPGLRAALAGALGERGMDVLEAGSGRELEEHLLPAPWRRHRAHVAPDVIVLGDLPPDGVGGLEALRRVRVVDQETPVILLHTADSFQAHLEAARLGVAAFFDKPVDLAAVERLVACLVEVPRRRVTRRAAPAARSPSAGRPPA